MRKPVVLQMPIWRVLLPAVLLLLGCAEEKPQDARSDPDAVFMQGTVVFVSLEGGFYGIVGDDGSRWDPENLPDSFAIDSLRVSFRGVPSDLATVRMWGRPIALVSIERIGGPPRIDLEPFRERARIADCADVRNRLFLIDRQVVLWDRESRCADAGYALELYGRTVSHLVCYARDSIAGPQEGCENGSPYQAMFRIIADNLDRPDLGLGSAHRVEPVAF